MRLSLKTKFTLAISLLVLAVVAVVSGLYLGQLTKQVLRQSEDRASFVAQQVFLACQSALADAAERGEAPASSTPEDLREYVHRALDNSSTLNSLMESAVGYSKTIYEITISDWSSKCGRQLWRHNTRHDKCQSEEPEPVQQKDGLQALRGGAFS